MRDTKRVLSGFLAACTILLVFAGCGGSAKGEDALGLDWANLPVPAKETGITVKFNRTDMDQAGILARYKAEFEKANPNCKITWDCITNYESIVMQSLPSGTFGDVALIPHGIAKESLPMYFTAFGTLQDFGNTYNYLDVQVANNNVYGIPDYGTAIGLVYNKSVLRKSGLSDNPADFPRDLKTFYSWLAAIDAALEKTDGFKGAYYTNFKDKWPLESWGYLPTVFAGNAAYYYGELPESQNAFEEGQPLYASQEVLYTIVKNGWSEADPSTTDWENCKVDFNRGKIGFMLFGSWAFPQFVEKAETLKAANAVAGDAAINPSDVGFMPFPYEQVSGPNAGKIVIPVSPDYYFGINKKSSADKKIVAARFLKWLTEESGFSDYAGGVSPLKGAANPSFYDGFTEANRVVLVGETSATGNMEGKLSAVEAESSIGMRGEQSWRERIVEEALKSNGQSYKDYIATVSAKWKRGIADVFGN
ncbi:sugar ABC transporter substrate-binding protein [Spirochaetia bacterium]|nr:sugar ABC transporter substrate-binding protein [Spirochaetia bacterium]